MYNRDVLAKCPLLAGLSPEALDRLAADSERVELPSGRTLFERGTSSDGIYIVATGRLVALRADGGIAGLIAHLEPIGEVSAISGEPHTMTVRAMRDCLLIRIPQASLQAALHAHPEAMLQITRVIIRRMRRDPREQQLTAARRIRSVAVIPATGDADARGVAEQLCAALGGFCRPGVVDAASVDAALGPGASGARIGEGEAHARLVEYLNALESDHEYLIYLAGRDAGPWARRCMRQADRILVVADARTPAIASAMVHELHNSGAQAPVELVMQRPSGVTAPHVSAWRQRLHARGHFFVRPSHAPDYASLARQLTGRGIGIVLGGGGARGFAHIGLMRALAELGIPVDLVGGSSMGAFFAALMGCGYDHHEQLHIARETFVRKNYLNDYLFPSVALIRGRRFVQQLHRIFEERRIEELRKPYFCVSTNLTRGTAMVHDEGPLYMWVATSMAVPGVAPPVVYRGELLADGAVVNSLPTDVMQNLQRGPIIASDVSTEGGIGAPGIEGPDPEALFRWRGEGERPRLFSIIYRTATLTSESGTAQRAARADLYLRMPVSRVGLFDWKRFDEIVERGYQHALEGLAPMREQLLRA